MRQKYRQSISWQASNELQRREHRVQKRSRAEANNTGQEQKEFIAINHNIIFQDCVPQSKMQGCALIAHAE
jgi:hypothetical protein